LSRQDYLRSIPTKVFVADANSTDRTVELALNFQNDLDIAVIPGGLPSVARNNGAKESISTFILFLDADVELTDTTLIRRAVRAMRTRALHCATVDIHCGTGTLADRLLYRASNLAQHLSTWHRPFGTGMFLLVDRARFESLGGFSEEALFAEDYHFTRQISPLRFAVVDGSVDTSNRRFQKTGHFNMTLLFFRTMLHRNNPEHFKNSHGYWNTPVTGPRPRRYYARPNN
jgi:glycosyltransferase involved in cell wall biosynthesis